MRIQSINNNVVSKGLYFTKTSNVLFNKDKSINYLNNDAVKISEQGFRYIEDTSVAENIKEKFANIPFVKNLAEKFDVFVFFRELPVGHHNNFGNTHFAFSKISWAEIGDKEAAEIRIAKGNSPVLQEYATEKMFKNIEKENFSEIA